MNKKIIFISTSRADYNLIRGLYNIIKLPKSYIKKLIVTGTSLSKKYGYDKTEFSRIKKIFVNLNSSSELMLPRIISNYFIKFYFLLKKQNPNYLILLGDRYETLVLAFTAKVLGIKILHFHGGEKSFGSMDNEWRNIISNLSDFHFVSHSSYKKNLIKMGIKSNNIYNVGAVGAYLLEKYKSKKLKIANNYKKKIIVTFHPATKNLKKSREEFNEMINSITNLNNMYFCITYPGHDSDSDDIIKKLDKLKRNYKNIDVIKKVSINSFYNYLKNFDLFMGNSSSGIIESASANIPFLNIGIRQKGRLKSKNVFDVNGKSNLITRSIISILKLKKKKYKNIYLNKNFEKKINQIINTKLQ